MSSSSLCLVCEEYVSLIVKLRKEISFLKVKMVEKPGSAGTIVNSSNIERTVMNALRNEIVLSFKERMQLRKSLIELDSQNVQVGA